MAPLVAREIIGTILNITLFQPTCEIFNHWLDIVIDRARFELDSQRRNTLASPTFAGSAESEVNLHYFLVKTTCCSRPNDKQTNMLSS